MYSHIIFDLDGTLVESLPGIATALNAALSELSLPTHPEAAVRLFIGDGSHMLCKRAAPDQTEDFINTLHASFLKEYALNWKSGTHVYSGITELINALKEMNCTLSVLTNKPQDFASEIVDYLFQGNPFDLVLGHRQGCALKPDPSGVHELLGDLGHSTANSILVGDSTIDIVTARNAGISSVAVTWGYHDKARLAAVSPQHTAHTIEQLLQIFTPTHTPAFRSA